MTGRRRRLSRAAAAATGLLVLLLTATPALASTLTVPPPVTAHGELTLSGVIEEAPAERTGVAELRLTPPGTDVPAVAVARSQQPSPANPRSDPARVSFVLTTAPCNLPTDGCKDGAVLPNGTFTLQLFEVDRGPARPEVERGTAATFVVDVPAGTPEDVKAAIDGRQVTVGWARGVGPDRTLVEPDVRWTVDDGKGRSVAVGPEACSAGTCTAVLRYPDGASGSRRYTVVASRPGTAAPTASAASSEVVVPVVAGAPSEGAAGPGSSPGASAGPGAGAGAPGATPGSTGISGAATAQSFAQGFSSFAPSLGLPKLPGLPETTAPSVAEPDTFDRTLRYDGELDAETGPPDPVAAPQGRDGVLTSTGGLLGDEQVLRSLAGALLLLLTGAHLRTWLARTRAEDAEI